MRRVTTSVIPGNLRAHLQQSALQRRSVLQRRVYLKRPMTTGIRMPITNPVKNLAPA